MVPAAAYSPLFAIHQHRSPPSMRMTVNHALAGDRIRAQIAHYDVHMPTDLVLPPMRFWTIDLCLTPRPFHMLATYPQRWPGRRMESMGDIFLVPPGEALRIQGETGRQASFTCWLDPASLAAAAGGTITWTDDRLAAALDINNARIRALLLRLMEEVRHPGRAAVSLLDLYAEALAIEVARFCLDFDEHPSRGGLASWRLRVIDERIAQPLPPPRLTELADLCRMSVRHLTRGFRVSRGCTLGAYLDQRRMETAKRLLDTGKSVKGIACALGFGSSAAFTFAFRRATGLSPSAFRAYQQRVTRADV